MLMSLANIQEVLTKQTTIFLSITLSNFILRGGYVEMGIVIDIKKWWST